MDHDHEIASLAAETLALQSIISHVFYRVSCVDPKMAAAVRAGLDDAANQIEALAIQAGANVNPAHLTKAVAIVEQLRTATVGRGPGPKQAV
jgi:hypothetical protein